MHVDWGIRLLSPWILEERRFDLSQLRARDAIKSANREDLLASRALSSYTYIIDVYPLGISRRLTVAWLISGGGLARPKMTLNLDGGNGTNSGGNGGQLAPKKPGGLSLGLPLEISTARGSADLVDVDLPLERQGYVLRNSWLVNASRRRPVCALFSWSRVRWRICPNTRGLSRWKFASILDGVRDILWQKICEINQ